MPSIRQSRSRLKPEKTHILTPFLLSYRREFWSLDTAPRRCRFETADQAREFLARVSRRKSKGGALHARLEVRNADGRWRGLPLKDGRAR